MTRRLHLVRHGPPVIDPAEPPHRWGLDDAGLPAISQLRTSGRLPADARWFSSPEAKALATAMRLTDSEVVVVDALREHQRAATPWFAGHEEWFELVGNAFTRPDAAAHPGWEPLAATRDRVSRAVRRIIADHPSNEIVLVGHGTAWTVLKAELTGEPPDLDGWAALGMPDLWVVDLPAVDGSISGTTCRQPT